MNRKLKALGLALVASLAMGIVAASAQAGEFHAGATHTILSGGQTTQHTFTAGSGIGSITCSTASFSGTTSTLTTTTKEQTITASYSGCKDSLGRTAHVSMNSCDYLFTAPVSGGTEGTVHVKCATPGDSITITVTSSPHCTIHIGEQLNLGKVTYHNQGSGSTADILVSVHIEKIASRVEGGFFVCGTSTTNQTAGTYTGSTTLQGKTTAGANTSIKVS